HGDRGTIVRRARDRDLELARQVRELGVQHGVLAQELAIEARIRELVARDAGVLIRRDVAHAIARRLDRRDLDARELLENVRHLLETNPIELDVLAGREMAEAAIVRARGVRELAQLLRRQRAVRHVDAQHVGMQLQVDAVLKAQRLELFLGNLAGETALHLPSELGDALGDEPMIEFIVTVHRSLLRSARVGPQWKALYWPAARRSSGRRRV